MKKLLVVLAFLVPVNAFADAGLAESDKTVVVPSEEAVPAAGLDASPAPVVEVPDLPTAVSGATNAFRNSDWLVLVGSVFAILVALLRWLGGLKISWLKTKLGGVVLAGATALLAALSVPFIDGQPFSWHLLLGALVVAWKGAGLHGHAKDFAEHLKK